MNSCLCPQVSWVRRHSKDPATATYRFTGKAARFVGQRSLEDLVHPGGGRVGIAVVVLTVQRAVSEAAIGLFLLPLLLQKVCDGVEQVVQELVGILLHVVVKQLWWRKQKSSALRILEATKVTMELNKN